MRLYPRLTRRFAEEEFRRQATLSPQELRTQAATSHPLQTWPPTGAPRISADELETTRDRLMAVADEHGWPDPLSRDEQRTLDLDLARVLWEDTELTPAEAGSGDVWSFLGLVVAPDVLWWRAAGSSNVERFVGTDLTRHTLARLWWRAHLFTWGLDDVDEGWKLWRESPIGEAELDQIQTRRIAYGRSPKTSRALVRLYPQVIAIAQAAGLDGRDLWRSSYLRWVLRLGAFTEFSALREDEIEQELQALLAQLELAAGASRPGPASIHNGDDEEDEEVDALTTGIAFDDVPLRTIVVSLTETVRAWREVKEGDLCDALEDTTGIQIPASRRDIVRGIAWQGQALHYLRRDDDNGVPVWRPGTVLPAPDGRWGDWTVTAFIRHVADQDGGADRDRLAADLFAGKPGRTIRRLVNFAMKERNPTPARLVDNQRRSRHSRVDTQSGDALALRDALAEALRAQRERDFREWSPELQEAVARTVPRAIAAIVGDTLPVKGSTGFGRQAEIPWVMVLPPGVEGASEGRYVVYLFQAHGEAVYLCLSQAVTGVPKRALRGLAQQLRDDAGEQPDLLDQIDLGAGGGLGERYTLATAYATEYRSGSLPDEQDLHRDLFRFLALVDKAGPRRPSATDVDPEPR